MVDNPSGGKMCSSDRDPKVIFLRDCLNKVMRCGLVRRVVIQYLYWSIMIYITFMVKQDGFKKGHALHNWHNILFTSLVHTFKRGERPTFLPPFPFHQNAQVSSNLGCCSVRKQFFFSSNDRTLVVGLRAFSLDSNLSGCWGTMRVYNLFKCLTRQKDDGGRLLMAK